MFGKNAKSTKTSEDMIIALSPKFRFLKKLNSNNNPKTREPDLLPDLTIPKPIKSKNKTIKDLLKLRSLLNIKNGKPRQAISDA
jgi:hypothetical protein